MKALRLAGADVHEEEKRGRWVWRIVRQGAKGTRWGRGSQGRGAGPHGKSPKGVKEVAGSD